MTKQGKYQNRFGDREFLVEEQVTHQQSVMSFDFKCNPYKLHVAQQIFLQSSCVKHAPRSKPIIVKSIASARNQIRKLRIITEYWETYHSTKPLWNLSVADVSRAIQSFIIKKCAKQGRTLYSRSVIEHLIGILNLSHEKKVLGDISDGLSFKINNQMKQEFVTPVLSEFSLPYAEWIEGGTIPPIPLGIAAVLLAKSIQVMESEKTAIAIALYSAWQITPASFSIWFKSFWSKLDIVERCLRDGTDINGIMSYIAKTGQDIEKLPWQNMSELGAWCEKVATAGTAVIFIQTGHRYAELSSAISTERKQLNQIMFIRETLNKSLGGARVDRPIPRLAADATRKIWALSFVSSEQYPLPLCHRGYRSTIATKLINNGEIPNNWEAGYEYATMRTHLQKFYEAEVLSHHPEFRTIHPELSFHQFRHTYAEFALRRFDSGVDASLREQFFHADDKSILRYEKRKLDKDTRTAMEQKYLYDLIGREADGLLDQEFWGPAFNRLQKWVSTLKVLPPDDAEAAIRDFAGNLDRLAVFEWGYCILMKNQHAGAKCLDPITGLPDIEAFSGVPTCIFCPNNMHSKDQKGNLIRAQLLHTEIAEAHPIMAIGKLSLDIAHQIAKRLRK